MNQLILHLASAIGKITLLLITFSIGLIATLLWWEVFPPTVTLCQLARNPQWFKYRTVRVEANAWSMYGAVFIEDESCQSPDGAAGVWQTKGYEPTEEVRKLYSESETEIIKARIVVTGRFDPEATMGCFAPKFAIHANNVELKSEITTEPIKRRHE